MGSTKRCKRCTCHPITPTITTVLYAQCRTMARWKPKHRPSCNPRWCHIYHQWRHPYPNRGQGKPSPQTPNSSSQRQRHAVYSGLPCNWFSLPKRPNTHRGHLSRHRPMERELFSGTWTSALEVCKSSPESCPTKSLPQDRHWNLFHRTNPGVWLGHPPWRESICHWLTSR